MQPPPGLVPQQKSHRQHPQKSIDRFWDKFTTKHPGKVSTVLPENLYAKRAAAAAAVVESDSAKNCLTSYEEAVAACKAKVEKITRECRRVNQKYRDPHFDIESDFQRSKQNPEVPQDCLTGLDKQENAELVPQSVKRVEVGVPPKGSLSICTDFAI